MPRPLPLTLMAIVFAILGTLVVLLAGIVGFQVITWDVKGHLLTGGVLALFASALAGLGALALGAAAALWKGRPVGRLLALGFWVAAGSLALVTDRSVAGPGEPLRTYLVDLILAPGTITAALLWGVPSVRRFFRHRSSARPPATS
jgi:hypothetical protein